MQPQRIRQGVPAREVKSKPLYSTLMDSVNALAILAAALAVAYTTGAVGGSGAYLMYPFLLIMAGCLAYVLLYKRRNYKFVAEDGLYFVRRGYATHIPWGMVKGIAFVPGGLRDHMLVKLMEGPAKERECRFRYDLKAMDCFRRHVKMAEPPDR